MRLHTPNTRCAVAWITRKEIDVADDNKCFSVWMGLVDMQLESRFGCGSSDLPDCCYRDWFDDGLSPEEAVECMMEELDLYGFGF